MSLKLILKRLIPIWLLRWWRKDKKMIRCLMLGLDNAGKTSIPFLKYWAIMYRLIEDKKKCEKEGFSLGKPTMGFIADVIKYNKWKFNLWDIGGKRKLRILWWHFFSNNHVLIFVVDSSDKDRLDEACLELHNLLQNDDLKNILLLVFANKQNLSGAMRVSEIVEALKLEHIEDHFWYIQPCCAISGCGLYQGLSWISTMHQISKYLFL